MQPDEPSGAAGALDAALTALTSSNPLVQNEGVDAAIHIGAPAVEELLRVARLDADARPQAMFALAEIADVRAAGAFRTALRDGDERVRAYAALGLGRIGDPGGLDAHLQTLNDAPDPLHLDVTPSVQALGEMGLRAVPPLLDLLMHDDELTRLRAQRSLELILGRRHGFRPGEGFPSPAAQEYMQTEWSANGDYRYDADVDQRAAAVSKWRRWLAAAQEEQPWS